MERTLLWFSFQALVGKAGASARILGTAEQNRSRREAVPASRAPRRMDDSRYPGAGFGISQQGLGSLPWRLELLLLQTAERYGGR